MASTKLILAHAAHHGVTCREATFAHNLIRTGDFDRAREATGLSASDARAVSCKESFLLLVKQEAYRYLAEIVAPMAIQRIREAAEKGAAPNRVQIDACKTVLDRIGFVPPKAAEPERRDLDLTEMTTDQLQAFISETNKELDARGAPGAIDTTPQVPDWLE